MEIVSIKCFENMKEQVFRKKTDYIIISGLILKKTKPFLGDPAPFVIELPAYHFPVARNIFHATWERGWSFVKRAGTVILAASVIIWVLNSLSFEGGLHYITGDEASILNVIEMAKGIQLGT